MHLQQNQNVRSLYQQSAADMGIRTSKGANKSPQKSKPTSNTNYNLIRKQHRLKADSPLLVSRTENYETCSIKHQNIKKHYIIIKNHHESTHDKNNNNQEVIRCISTEHLYHLSSSTIICWYQTRASSSAESPCKS